jgi:murein DD-endopeptidase MepM/ murein hydrolase activator NlpD
MGLPANGNATAKFGYLNTLEKGKFVVKTDCSSVKTSNNEICLTDFLEDYGLHAGVDIHFQNSDLNLYAVYDGVVVGTIEMKKWDDNGGSKIIVEHIFNGEKIYSVYFHVGEILVAEGTPVAKGSLIGLGSNEAMHLHYEMRKAAGVNMDEFGNYSSFPVGAGSYWANSLFELDTRWVDISSRFGGYSKWIIEAGWR